MQTQQNRKQRWGGIANTKAKWVKWFFCGVVFFSVFFRLQQKRSLLWQDRGGQISCRFGRAKDLFFGSFTPRIMGLARKKKLKMITQVTPSKHRSWMHLTYNFLHTSLVQHGLARLQPFGIEGRVCHECPNGFGGVKHPPQGPNMMLIKWLFRDVWQRTCTKNGQLNGEDLHLRPFVDWDFCKLQEGWNLETAGSVELSQVSRWEMRILMLWAQIDWGFSAIRVQTVPSMCRLTILHGLEEQCSRDIFKLFKDFFEPKRQQPIAQMLCLWSSGVWRLDLSPLEVLFFWLVFCGCFEIFYRLTSWTSFLHPTAIWCLWLCRASADSRWWSCWYKATVGPDSMFRSYRFCLVKMLCECLLFST